MPEAPILVWFRQDLRLADNPALAFALREAEGRRPVLPLYLWTPAEEGEAAPGAAARWWLHHALADLGTRLSAAGLGLTLQQGETALALLAALLEQTGADTLCWNRRYEPSVRARDAQIKQTLQARGVTVRSFNSALLHEPMAVLRDNQAPYRVFSAYQRAADRLPKRAPVSLPALPTVTPREQPRGVALESLDLLPRIRWDAGLAATWQPTLAGGEARLQRFLQQLESYGERRDLPAEQGTSELSPYLHFGQLGPRQLWQALADRPGEGAAKFASELYWREFSYYLLMHNPQMHRAPLQARFERLRWREAPDQLAAWQRGQTGYPLVDAGMRQLWQTGWMHNRVRMVVASFLTKHLLLPWQAGAAWFLDTLVDADLANNAQGWQWAAGCGVDASPYTRIFNPTLQGRRFDADGRYLRHYLPELGRLPDRHIHEPAAAPPAVLAAAGVQLGRDYPPPIVPHREARERALATYAAL